MKNKLIGVLCLLTLITVNLKATDINPITIPEKEITLQIAGKNIKANLTTDEYIDLRIKADNKKELETQDKILMANQTYNLTDEVKQNLKEILRKRQKELQKESIKLERARRTEVAIAVSKVLSIVVVYLCAVIVLDQLRRDNAINIKW